MKSKIKLFITITYILIFKENDEIYRFYFCQKNKFSDSDEIELDGRGTYGMIWRFRLLPWILVCRSFEIKGFRTECRSSTRHFVLVSVSLKVGRAWLTAHEKIA